MTKDSLLFFQLVRDFLKVYLPDQKGASPKTIKSYTDAINQFLDYACEKLGIKLNSFGFAYSSQELVLSYLDEMEKQNHWSVATRNQRLSALRSFFKYAANRDRSLMGTYMEMLLIETKTAPDKTIEFFSEKALKTILDTAAQKTTKKGRRNLVLLVLLYDTAGRIQEILDLKVGDLCLARQTKSIILTGKGKKTRELPLMDSTVKHLEAYLKEFHRNSSDSDPLFYLNRHGIKCPLSQDAVTSFTRKIVDEARKSCPEIQEHFYLHMFRHTRAMHLYRNGMPLELVSEYLGHKQVETTLKFYANADMEMKKKAVDKATSNFDYILNQENRFTIDDDDDEVFKILYGLS